jgi:flagellar M-ring protein FliF
VNLAAFIDFLRQLRAQSAANWAQLNLNARVMIVGVGLAVALPILFVTFQGGATRYITLADNLTAQQIAETETLLVEKGVPYDVDESARSIKVLPKDRGAMLLLLEQNNLPVGASTPTGFEDLFANPDFMSNQWLNDVKFMRAVQGQLEEQLNMLDFVETSQVFIREADQALFVDEQIPSEASVVLEVNRPVSKPERKLLVSMVARAGGANLHPGNITISTTSGEALHLPANSEFASIASDKLEYQNEVETRIQRKIESGLTDMGVHGTVMVSANIDFDKKETVAELVAEGVPLSELSTTQNIQSTEQLPQGAPGALTNVPEATATAGGINTTDTMKETLTNHEPSRTTTKTISDPGNVVKYSVALVVKGDDVTQETGADGQPVETYNGISEKLRDACQQLAQSAVALEEGVADVSIIDHNFETAGVAALDEVIRSRAESEQMAMRQNWYLTAGLLIAFVVALFLIRSMLNKAIVWPQDEKPEERVKDIPEATLEDMRRQEVAAEIAQLSMQDPEAVAALLRSWMSQDED